MYLQKDAADDEGHAVDTAIILEEVTIVPIELPEFHPPNCRKRDLYYDADVFKELDEYVFSVSAPSMLMCWNGWRPWS